jgi:peroxiredoxin Q/BCP
MVSFVTILLSLLAALSILGVRPEVGDAAPDFKLRGSDGQLVSLGAYRGKKTVVLAFFPKAFTPG